MRTHLIVTFAALLLAGCNGGWEQHRGESTGLGGCRDRFVEVQILDFSPANETLQVRYSNHGAGVLSSVSMGIQGKDAYVNDFEGRWDDSEIVRDGLRAHENATATWQIRGHPDAPWNRIDYAYLYDFPDRSRMINLRCSLEGQEAPFSFDATAAS